MTVRVSSPLSSSRLSPAVRGANVRSMLERLLGSDTAPGLLPGGARSGRVAIVRGFDVASREFRGLVGELAKPSGFSLLDVPSAPSFGAVPAAEDVRLVVVARSALIPLAERCAAFWDAPVLGPAVADGDSEVSIRPVPALRVSEQDRPVDGVASRLSVTRAVQYRIGGGPRNAADAFGVEPSSAGILVQTANRGDETLRVAKRPVDLRLDQDTEAMLDGNPVLLPAGEYTIDSRPEAFRRIVAA